LVFEQKVLNIHLNVQEYLKFDSTKMNKSQNPSSTISHFALI